MSDSPTGFSALMQQARDLETRFASMREALARRELSASAGAGLVRVTANGAGQILRVEIDREAMADVEILQDLIRSATNEALARVQDLVQGEVQRAAGPLSGLLGSWLKR